MKQTDTKNMVSFCSDMAGQPLFDEAYYQPTVFGCMGFDKEECLTKKEKQELWVY